MQTTLSARLASGSVKNALIWPEPIKLRFGEPGDHFESGKVARLEEFRQRKLDVSLDFQVEVVGKHSNEAWDW